MPLPYWFYSGRTTTPISYKDENGNLVSEILEPRRLFHAPQAAVSHLLKLKPPRVKRMPDPPPEKEKESKIEKFAKKAATQTQQVSPPKSEAAQEKNDSSETKSSGDVIPSPGDSPTGEGEGTTSEPVEKEKVAPPRKRRREQQG